MSENSLPKEYKGFSTAELLKLWKNIPDATIYDPPEPEGKIDAMRQLLYEYALMDFGNDEPAKIRRSKELLAPFGIDPAPWTDENGVTQESLSKAFVARLRKEEAARRKRNKELYAKYGPSFLRN